MTTRVLVIAPTEREFESVRHENKVWIRDEADLLKIKVVDEPPIVAVLHTQHWRRVMYHKKLQEKAKQLINVGIAVVTKSVTEFNKYIKPIHKRVRFFHIDSLEAARNNYYVTFVCLPYANHLDDIVEILCVIQERMVEDIE